MVDWSVKNNLIKVLGNANSKNILNLAGVCRVEGTDVMQVSVTRPPSPLFSKDFTNTQLVQLIICHDLLSLDCSDILLKDGVRRFTRVLQPL